MTSRTPDRARPLDLSCGGALLEVQGTCLAAETVELGFAGRDAAGRPQSWDLKGRVVRVEPGRAGGDLSRVAVAFDRPLPEECLIQQVQRAKVLRAAQGGRA